MTALVLAILLLSVTQCSGKEMMRVTVKPGGQLLGYRTLGVDNIQNLSLIDKDASAGRADRCHVLAGSKDIPASVSCPASCPYRGESGVTSCSFMCLTASECGSKALGLDETATVAAQTTSSEQRYCRQCGIVGCKVCKKTEEVCEACSEGYELVNGVCESIFRYSWYCLYGIIAIIVLYCLVWFIDIHCRAVDNEAGLNQGLEFRSRTKLHSQKGEETRPLLAAPVAGGQEPTGVNPQLSMVSEQPPPAAAPLMQGAGPIGEQYQRKLIPLSTNLMSTPVAGPGTVLHFRYQLWLIVWGVIAAGVWFAIVTLTDRDLLEIGLKRAETPLELCKVVDWGYVRQHELMWAKVLFLGIMYLITFFGSLIFSAMQQRLIMRLDDNTTMRDFVLYCRGLPIQSGAEPVEEQMKTFFQEQTEKTVIGVSIAWDWIPHFEEVKRCLDAEWATPTDDRDEVNFEESRYAREGGLRWKLLGIPDRIMGFGLPVEEEDIPNKQHMLTNLKSMETSGSAFIVFEDEVSRNAALQVINDKGGISFEGNRLTFSKTESEPETVRWDGFSYSGVKVFIRTLIGILLTVVTLCGWAFVFYLPYANYVATTAFADGLESNDNATKLLTYVVVGGNLAVYFICAAISEWIGFRFEDSREAYYLVTYSCAIFSNAVLDFFILGYISYYELKAHNAHTFAGLRLGELKNITDIFESYPMQRAVGNQMFNYCWPSCFFLPFVMEPIGAIALPLHVVKILTRCHSNVKGRQAERALAVFAPMDMGRYGDVLLNLVLVTCIGFAPPGFMLQTLVAFCGSHIFIYFLDQYRVLRCVPGFCYAAGTVEWFAEAIFSIPCGILLAGAIFKANCKVDQLGICFNDDRILFVCASAFFTHCCLHIFLQTYVVPLCLSTNHIDSQFSYAEVAEVTPATWFNTNPIHCLRSQCFYKHEPAHGHYVRGKEHTLRPNSNIGAHFKDDPAETEPNACLIQ